VSFFHQYCCYVNINIPDDEKYPVIELEDSSYYYMYQKEIYQIKFTKLCLGLPRENFISKSYNDVIVVAKNSNFEITLMEGCSKSKIQDEDLEPTILKIIKEGLMEKIVIPLKDAKINLNLIKRGILEGLQKMNLFKDNLKNEEAKTDFEYSLTNKNKTNTISRLNSIVNIWFSFPDSYLSNLKEFMTNKIVLESKLIVLGLMKGISRRDDFSIFNHFQKVVFEINWNGFIKTNSEITKLDLYKLESSLLDSPYPSKIEFIFEGDRMQKINGWKIVLDKSNKPRCKRILEKLFLIKTNKQYRKFCRHLFTIY